MDDSDLWDDVPGPSGDGDWPDQWTFDEVGDVLKGTLTKITPNVPTKFGDKPVIEVTQDDGKQWSYMLVHANVTAQMKEKRPRTGDSIAIRYDGLGEAKPGKNAPNLYTVEVQRKDVQPTTSEPAATPAPSSIL